MSLGNPNASATATRSTSSFLSFSDYFDGFASLFGDENARRRTEQYVQAILERASRDAPGAARTLDDRASRRILAGFGWQPDTVVDALQRWAHDHLNAPDGVLVLLERSVPARDMRTAGAAQQFSPREGRVIRCQVALLLGYVSSRGSALIDARLYLPPEWVADAERRQRASIPGNVSYLSKAQLGLAMVRRAREEVALETSLVAIDEMLGQDVSLRDGLQAEGCLFVAEVSPSTQVLVSTGRGSKPAAGAAQCPVASVLDQKSVALQPRVRSSGSDGARSREPLAFRVWENRDGAPVRESTLLVRAPEESAEAKYFIASGWDKLALTRLVAAERAPATIADAVDAGSDGGLLEACGDQTWTGWHRHAALAMLVTTYRLNWRSDGSAQAVRSMPSPLTDRRPLGHFLRIAMALGAVLVVALLVLAGSLLGPTISRVDALGGREVARYSIFYHPPGDSVSVSTVAQRHGLVVLTRGDERYRDQLRSAGFRGPVLQYLVANEASGPGGLRRASDRCGGYLQTGNDVTGIAQDFCATLHENEENFLHNSRGERLFSTLSYREGNNTRTRTYYLMNPASPTWRAYFAQRARENLEAVGYTGLFLDNVDLSLERGRRKEANSNGTVAEFSAQAAYRDAVVGFLAEVRGAIGSASLWANLTEGDNSPGDLDAYMQYLDGVMNEYFVAQSRGSFVPPATWENQLSQAERVLQGGKQFLAVGQGPKSDTPRMRFALASYLLIAEPGSYFRYTQDDKYDEAWIYDDYSVRLGSPISDRYRDGALWRRDFACGRVSVDPAARSGTFETNLSQPGCLIERAVARLRYG